MTLSRRPPRTPRLSALCLLAALSGVAPALSAQQEAASPGPAPAPGMVTHAAAPMASALPRTGRIVVDGRIDDEGWVGAHVIGGFTQVEPREGEAPSERTEVFVVYDEDAIYIGARLWDSQGDVRKRLARRDSFLMDSDWFNVMLDTHHGHVSAYQFSLNPAGVKRDEVTSGGRMGDTSWDAVWEGRASVDEQGWTVEMRIPFSQLRFSSADVQTWGIQFQRRINRLQELSVFAFTPRAEAGGVARYGHLIGLESLSAGRRLEIMPYALGRADYVEVAPGDPFRDGSAYGSGFGLDALFRLTTSMTLTATVNPDFGQVEVDPAVVNLTAFETSFQERRPFFVEGADLFRFGLSSGAAQGPGAGGAGGGGMMMGGGGGGGMMMGGGGGGTQLVYSRRIGRSPQGSLPGGVAFSDAPDAATILGAAKVTGRTTGGWSLGLLGARTGTADARWVDGEGGLGTTVVEPPTNYVMGRAVKDLRAGQTQIGLLATAVDRDLGDDGLAALLRSRAFSGGVDFSHEFLRRTWSVEGTFAASHVTGSPDAMLRTQRQSSRYFQRPDAGHLTLDPDMTSMTGYTARVEVGKRAGLHWRGDASAALTTPGFEINDIGFQTGVDRLTSTFNVSYVQSTPQGWFRNWRVNAGPQVNWNLDGDFVGGRTQVGLNGQFTNFWGGGLNINKRIVGFDDRLTRGGPLVRDRAGQSIGGNVNSDNRKKLTARLNFNYSWGEGEGLERRLSGNLQIRPVETWTISVGPSYSNTLTYAQYVTTVTDALASETYGRRYVFTGLEQTTVSMDTRLSVNFTPELSLELFAQPLISTGDFGALRELRAPRTYDFLEYGKDVGSMRYDAETRLYTIDPDEGGPAEAFTLRNRDFTTRSLRGNAVLRWEYRPGSTLYLVWQQSRSGSGTDGTFDLRRDAGDLFDARADNFFVVKVNYWLNF